MIVFSGSSLIAHYNEGSSDYLLVSFNQLHCEASAETHYLLQSQVEQAGISTVGITTRAQNFYLDPEIEHIATFVHSQRHGRKLILTGQSMGAYAAIKHSKLFAADYVIAFSPFCSLDPEELEFPSNHHQRIFASATVAHSIKFQDRFRGMGIRADDAVGRITVFYDPSEPIDSFNAKSIKHRIRQAELIQVPHAGHVIYDASWESALLTGLIEAVRTESHDVLSATMNMLRRENYSFLIRTLSKAANRKPLLFTKAVRSSRIRTHRGYRDFIRDPVNLRAVFLLITLGQQKVALDHLDLVIRDSFGIDVRPVIGDAATTPIQDLNCFECLIVSVHGSFLCWDTERDSARFEPHPFNLRTRLPIVARSINGQIRFSALNEGIVVAVSPFHQDAVSTDLNSSGVIAEITAGSQVSLSRDGRYLGATPDGAAQFLPAVTNQQRLVVLPLYAHSSLFDSTSIETSRTPLYATPARPSNDAVPVVQKRSPRWRGRLSRN